MRQRPTGTVTLLFTDVEGSTRLLDRLRSERYADVLAEHRRLLREAFAAHGGVEVDTQGDAFFVAFSRPQDALAAAAQGQRALAAHPWPGGIAVRVRMGVHTGTPSRTEEGYVGMDVHRAARVMAAGHGGQVVVSETTTRLLDGDDDGRLLDLGEHRLKDLGAPIRLYQLAGEALEPDFPALKTLGGRPNNLPAQPTALIGRERELAELRKFVGEARLVTLTGPGGSGKTRLALQLAAELIERFESGVFAVALAPIRDPALVLPTVAQALKLREQPGEPIAETLAEYLREREVLLVLDNLEQVIACAEAIASLLAEAPRLRVVATSREPLRIAGEQEYPVAPLAREDAIELFLERARAVKPSLETDREVVAEICRRLDDLPLAIELAAVRVKLLPVPALLERLDRRLKLLTGGARDADERQHTLRATIGWSHDLLSAEEQTLFRRLAVFAGGWTLESAEAVCAADGEPDVLDGLASLVDKSLVRRRDIDGEPRFSMLETIREFALDALEGSGEADGVRDRHAAYFAEVAEAAWARVLEDGETTWLDRVELDHDNVRAALAWTTERGQHVLALRLAASLWHFWRVRGHVREGRSWLERALAGSGTAPPPLRARALDGLAYLTAISGNAAAALDVSDEAVALWRAEGDTAGLARSLLTRQIVLTEAGDEAASTETCKETIAIARDAGLDDVLATSLNNLADHGLISGDYEWASALCEESIGIHRRTGDAYNLTGALMNAGHAKLGGGDVRAAAERYAEALELARGTGSPDVVAWLVGSIAVLAEARGEASVAARLLGASEALLRRAEASRTWPYEDACRARTLDRLRAVLSASELDAALRAGAAMTPDAALEEALATAGRESDADIVSEALPQ